MQLQPGSAAALSQVTSGCSPPRGDGGGDDRSRVFTRCRCLTADASQLAAELSANPAVEYAEPVQTVTDLTVPNDPDYTMGDEWQLNGTWGINVPGAWNVTTGSDQVIVADTDTGIAYNDPDLYDNVWINQAEIPARVMLPNLTDVYDDGVITFTLKPLNECGQPGARERSSTPTTTASSPRPTCSPRRASAAGPTARHSGRLKMRNPDRLLIPDDLIGWNFVNDTNNPIDQNGHGTFTAGEIGAVGNNGIGVAGVDWNVQIMPVQFLDSSGNGTDTAAAAGDRVRGQPRRQGHQRQLGRVSGMDPTIAAAIEYADAARRDHRRGRRQQRHRRRQQQHMVLPGLLFGRLPQPDLGGRHRQQRRPGLVVQLRRRLGPVGRPRRERLWRRVKRHLRLRQRHLDGRAPCYRHDRTGGGRPSDAGR